MTSFHIQLPNLKTETNFDSMVEKPNPRGSRPGGSSNETRENEERDAMTDGGGEQILSIGLDRLVSMLSIRP